METAPITGFIPDEATRERVSKQVDRLLIGSKDTPLARYILTGVLSLPETLQRETANAAIGISSAVANRKESDGTEEEILLRHMDAAALRGIRPSHLAHYLKGISWHIDFQHNGEPVTDEENLVTLFSGFDQRVQEGMSPSQVSELLKPSGISIVLTER